MGIILSPLLIYTIMKKNTAKERDPNSLRSKKRAKRGFKPSRSTRRAEKRLASAFGAYNPNDIFSNRPGSMKRW